MNFITSAHFNSLCKNPFDFGKIGFDDLVNDLYNWNQNSKFTLPLANAYSTDTEYVIELMVPGYQKNNISIEYDPDNNSLIISGKGSEEKDDKKYIQKCFSAYATDFKDSWSLSKMIKRDSKKQFDCDNIGSKLNNGILTISIPFKEEKKTESLKIKIE